MLKIGEFSKLSRISVRMLRHYGEKGLLLPAYIDPETGYRRYEERQLLTAGRIAALREMGFSLAAIRDLLAETDAEQTLRRLRTRRQELEAELDEVQCRLQLLDSALGNLEKGGTDMNITVKTIPSRYAATLRMTLPTYADESMGWEILMRETEPLALIPDDPCLCCAVFHDEEFKESDVDVELQKTVKGSYPDTEHVRFVSLPPITVASAVLSGPYDGLDDAMRRTALWVEENGYLFDGPSFCIYHISPHETDDPAQFVTEICYPVRRADA